MSKSVVVILVAAAAVVVGIFVWKSRKTAGAAAPAMGAPPPPQQPTVQNAVANAFSTLIGAATNQLSQWFSDRISGSSQGQLNAEKPPPLNNKNPSPALPAASTPNVRTEPTYFA